MEENMVIENEATEVVEETKKESKIKTFIKKHGKKIAVGAAIVAAAVIGKKIGERSACNVYDDCDMIEADFSEVDTIE